MGLTIDLDRCTDVEWRAFIAALDAEGDRQDFRMPPDSRALSGAPWDAEGRWRG